MKESTILSTPRESLAPRLNRGLAAALVSLVRQLNKDLAIPQVNQVGWLTQNLEFRPQHDSLGSRRLEQNMLSTLASEKSQPQLCDGRKYWLARSAMLYMHSAPGASGQLQQNGLQPPLVQSLSHRNV